MFGEREIYMSPFVGFCFHRLFGTERNEELAISFLNSLLKGEDTITDIEYDTLGTLGIGVTGKYEMFDLYCTNDKGGYFIVEMQKAQLQFFKDLNAYYSSFPICEKVKQAKDWDIKVDKIYTVGFLNFAFPENKDSDDFYHHVIMPIDVDDKQALIDKITYIYVELPKFNKTENQLETMLDKWLYALKNLSDFKEPPAALEDDVFIRFFEQAEAPGMLW